MYTIGTGITSVMHTVVAAIISVSTLLLIHGGFCQKEILDAV